jgi:mono/diheme cytochrome c family protein
VSALARTAIARTALALMMLGSNAATAGDVERGRYLVQIGSCNECHTSGYGAAQGRLPEARWLTGSPLPYQGPAGTVYATSLRLPIASMSETQWLDFARVRRRPPMPSSALQAMSDDDLRAIYRFVRSLGPHPEACSAVAKSPDAGRKVASGCPAT